MTFSNQLEFKNAWVFDTLNLPRQKFAQNDIKKNAGPTLIIYPLKNPTKKSQFL